jgi:hypothetical protein
VKTVNLLAISEAPDSLALAFYFAPKHTSTHQSDYHGSFPARLNLAKFFLAWE